VAIRYGRGDWDGVETEELAREQIFPVCSPRLARGAKQLSICEDLKHFTLLHGDIRQDWSTWLHVAGCGHFDATRGPRFDDAVPLIQAAIDGVGVALGRTLLVANDLAAGRLIAPFVTRLDAEFSYWIVTPRGRARHPRAAEFRTWLLAQIPPQ
jgi:LysR family glycine cleavage system transcriptional activator